MRDEEAGTLSVTMMTVVFKEPISREMAERIKSDIKEYHDVDYVTTLPVAKTVITIQPGNSPDGSYDVRWPMPYPFHVDAETGNVGYQDLWNGDPFRVVGFQKEAHVQKVDLFWHAAAANPKQIVGMFPVMLDTTGEEPRMYNLDTPITDVHVHVQKVEPTGFIVTESD